MTITASFRKDSPILSFAINHLIDANQEINETLEVIVLDTLQEADIVITSSEAEATLFDIVINPEVNEQGFEIRRAEYHGKSVVFILAKDESGAMYGIMELAERLRTYGKLSDVEACTVNARLPFRALKFNLPWSSYRLNECFDLQMETVRDLAFWQSFLDMMAENRYNVLTLWNMHPFPYMLRTVNFPKATPFTNEELSDWKEYWTTLFRMAKERGIETYVINWNIIVSEAFKEHYDNLAIDDKKYHAGGSYSTEQIKQYTRESIIQLIDEYPDLTGFGVSLGERMNDMTPEDRQTWIEEVYYAGMKQASRPIKFIHRAPFSVDPLITRTSIENNGFIPEPVWVEIKFNWSHAYSSSKLLLTHGGSDGMEGYWNPPPKNYKITWMVRNEDFFTLRWAQPAFIRKHLAENSHDYVGGYYIGSECFIPGKDYSHREASPHINWTYSFEKNWLYYMMWGRLLYDPTTPDRIFTDALDRRYGKNVGIPLLKAYSSVCKMPMALASFFSFTWDFTLYAEGFLSAANEYDSGKSFISLEDLLKSKPFDPAYLSLRAYAELLTEGQSVDGLITPLQLADTLEKDAKQGLTLISGIHSNDPTFSCEAADIEAWAYLNLYFAAKLRAGVSYALYERNGDETDRQKAVEWLSAPNAAQHWENLIQVTNSHYHEQPLMHLAKMPFNWELFRPQVNEDIVFASQRVY